MESYKPEYLFTADESSEKTVMNFGEDNHDNQSPESNNGQPNNKQNAPKPNRNFLSVLISGLLFIGMIALLLYFFVFRSSTSTITYTEADIVYHIDEDRDGVADYDGVPDGFVVEDGHYFKEYVVDAGTLSAILVSPDTYKVSLSVIESNTTSAIVYLSGSYQVLNTSTNRYTSYNFDASISRTDYSVYIIPIVRDVRYDKSGTDVAYYTSSTYSHEIQSSSSFMSTLLPIIIEFVVIAVIIYFVMRMFRSSGPNQQMSGFVNNVARKTNGTKVRFSDVAGCDEAKEELTEMVDYFHATDKYTRLGAKLPHGVLLQGPPGTGKTLLAKAVAGEANVPFYSISGSDFVEMYVGVGASRVRSLFKTAKASAPCLIFIDEIDAVGRQRGTGLGGGNDEREQTLNELLVEMDGFEDNNGIIVMAATNRSDVLDPALTRPGRFDRTITVDLPDKEGRAAILKVHSRNKKLAADVSFDNIASRTVGFSGADLANIMNDAAILAVRAKRSAITTADIDEAIDRAIAGPAKKSHLEEAEKKQVAYHESGHAIIGLYLPYSDKVQKITIIPRGRTGGHVLMTPEKDRFLMTKNQLLARITGYLGGRTSEEIFFGDVSTGASNDIEVATRIARSMVTEYGMSDLGPIQYDKAGGSVFLGRDYNSTQANYSTEIAFEIDKAIRQIIDDCHAQARQILEEHRADVELIANTLIEHETITADQISYLLEHRELPPVDEHKLPENKDCKNPNGIELVDGYGFFYNKIDEILASEPSRLVIAVATAVDPSISLTNFQKACVTGAKDPTKIGILLVDRSMCSYVSTSPEVFATHLESYAGVPVLLVKTDENSVQEIKDKLHI